MRPRSLRGKWLQISILIFLTSWYLSVTSVLVTDVGDEMCRWQVWDIDDRLEMLVKIFNIVKIANVTKNVTDLLKLCKYKWKIQINDLRISVLRSVSDIGSIIANGRSLLFVMVKGPSGSWVSDSNGIIEPFWSRAVVTPMVWFIDRNFSRSLKVSISSIICWECKTKLVKKRV